MRIRSVFYSMCLLGAACAHQQVDDLYGQRPSTPSASAPLLPAPSKEMSCSSDLECGEGHLCINNRCVAITPGMAECRDGRVHFDLDATELHPDERPVLQRMARCLKADHAIHISIDGNADERGTTEYNLALGDRRARTVAQYLKLLGVSDQQLSVVSYGKERPLCTEHTEACWHENRRASLMATR
jgi:peptidoglycan-associated lipoprotein